jgi:hypothetical protein
VIQGIKSELTAGLGGSSGCWTGNIVLLFKMNFCGPVFREFHLPSSAELVWNIERIGKVVFRTSFSRKLLRFDTKHAIFAIVFYLFF